MLIGYVYKKQKGFPHHPSRMLMIGNLKFMIPKRDRFIVESEKANEQKGIDTIMS